MENSIDKAGAIKILNSRKLITEAGKYQLTVTSVTPFQREDGTLVNIVNLAAMNDHQLGKAREAAIKGDYQAAVNTQLSASQRVNKDYIPKKGETVNVTLDFINTANAENALLITSLTEVPVSKATSVNFSFEEEEELAVATEGAGKV